MTTDNNTVSPSETKGENTTDSPTSTRDVRIGVRLSVEELATADRIADECGKCRSEYIRSVITGHHPKRRLTDEEVSAMNTLEGCRKQLQQFLNRVKGMTDSQRKIVFANPDFWKQWREYCETIMKQWANVRENILSTKP